MRRDMAHRERDHIDVMAFLIIVVAVLIFLPILLSTTPTT